MLISALMFRLPLRRGLQPFLKVVVPQASTATKAKMAVTSVAQAAHCRASEAIAASPAIASGHHGLAGFVACSGYFSGDSTLINT